MNLCVDCDWLDQKSRKLWEKALEKGWADVDDFVTEMDLPAERIQFDIRRCYCTNPRNKRQPKTDPVAGQHLDGPPYLRCREVRDKHPQNCPDWKERQNAEQA